MKSHTLSCLSTILAALALLCHSAQSTEENKNTQQQQQQVINTLSTAETHAQQNANLTAENVIATQSIANDTRHARLIKNVQDPKALVFKRYNAALQRVLARSDHLYAAGISQHQHRSPSASVGLSAYQKRHPPMMRRIQHGGPPSNASPPPRYTYEAPKGISNYPHSKASSVSFNAGKLAYPLSPFVHNQPQKPQQQPHTLQAHPNSLIPYTPTVVQQSVKQLQQQQLQQQQQQHQQQQYKKELNFKASPPFNGKAIVRPLLQPHDPNYRQHMQQLQQYVRGQPELKIKQYPIPKQPLHKQQKITPYYSAPTIHQAQSVHHTQQTPTYHYEKLRHKQEEPVLHPHVKHILPPPGSTGYAVYENNNLDEEEPKLYDHPYAYFPPTPHAEESAQASSYESVPSTNSDSAAVKEADEYIKFMNSHDYFLPKREPNYKQRDTQNDKQQQRVQVLQQQQTQLKQSQSYNYNPSATQKLSTDNDQSIDDYLNTPIKISHLFYQNDPVPAIVRTSYQTDKNQFVVKPDEHKTSKHIHKSSTARLPTTITPAYPKVRHNTPHNRTPEPLRFEFTERDAIPSAYTNSPSSSLSASNNQLHYKTSSTPDLPTTRGNHFVTATLSNADDPEDEEDVQSESSSFYGRMPVRQSTIADATTNPTSPIPIEQKDTEDYCERICANVQDSDEEIICGSDGYMYTSKAQMECYSTCLHIDVTVQSKGSCNVR